VILILWLLIAWAAAGCTQPTESWSTVRAWLNARKGPASMNISGVWKSTKWGAAYFRQWGNEVRGKLGAYRVFGTINGYTLSLAIYYSGALYYTATLRLDKRHVLYGNYYRTTRQAAGWPILLTRRR
jgi:hypothetical protein